MRDTDADWRAIAESDPFFGVITEERYRSQNLTVATKDAFYADGRVGVSQLMARFEGLWPDFAPRTGLDFGCGVGRLLLPMAERLESVTGVDIAPAMLGAARAEAECRAIDNVTLIEDIPEGTRYDWVNSSIVLQHIEPRRGFPILRRLIAATGQFLSIHLTFYRFAVGTPVFMQYDGERADVITYAAMPSGVMHMYDYDARIVINELFENGFTNLVLTRSDHGGHIGANIFSRRD